MQSKNNNIENVIKHNKNQDRKPFKTISTICELCNNFPHSLGYLKYTANMNFVQFSVFSPSMFCSSRLFDENARNDEHKPRKIRMKTR